MSRYAKYHFVFDIRKQFQEYEASFLNKEEAYTYARERLGEHAYITTDMRMALVRPRSLF